MRKKKIKIEKKNTRFGAFIRFSATKAIIKVAEPDSEKKEEK